MIPIKNYSCKYRKLITPNHPIAFEISNRENLIPYRTTPSSVCCKSSNHGLRSPDGTLNNYAIFVWKHTKIDDHSMGKWIRRGIKFSINTTIIIAYGCYHRIVYFFVVRKFVTEEFRVLPRRDTLNVLSSALFGTRAPIVWRVQSSIVLRKTALTSRNIRWQLCSLKKKKKMSR